VPGTSEDDVSSSSASSCTDDTLSSAADGEDESDDSEGSRTVLWDELTVDRVLDAPVWIEDLPIASFASLIDFESFIIRCEDVIQRQLLAFDYNTISSFNKFYQSYKKSGEDSLLDFVSDYDEDLVEQEDSLSCVGLSMALIRELQQKEKKYGQCFTTVSCEEAVKDVGAYYIGSPNNLKEHVIVAVRVSLDVAGESPRTGYILMDPGYHVSRPGSFTHSILSFPLSFKQLLTFVFVFLINSSVAIFSFLLYPYSRYHER
jgi:hypothetical protein